MSNPHLNIGKLDKDRYKIRFDTDDGVLFGEISVKRRGGPPY
jgi:hypothetical protein